MPGVTIYPIPAKQRLQNPKIPLADVEHAVNKVLNQLPQVPEFGFHNCTPKDAGRRLKEHLDGANKYHLLEHIAHGKRRIRENLTQYLDGKLPVWIRAPKYELDKVKALQYAARCVATAFFLRSLIQMEVAAAIGYCNEGIQLAAWAENNLTPAGLRTQAEQEVARVLQQVRADLQSQIQQQAASLECLI